VVGRGWLGAIPFGCCGNDWRSSLTAFGFCIIPSVLKAELVAGVPVSYRADSVWRSDAVAGVNGGFIGRYGKLVLCHCTDYDYAGWRGDGTVVRWSRQKDRRYSKATVSLFFLFIFSFFFFYNFLQFASPPSTLSFPWPPQIEPPTLKI